MQIVKPHLIPHSQNMSTPYLAYYQDLLVLPSQYQVIKKGATESSPWTNYTRRLSPCHPAHNNTQRASPRLHFLHYINIKIVYYLMTYMLLNNTLL